MSDVIEKGAHYRVHADVICGTIVEEDKRGPQRWPHSGRDGKPCGRVSRYVVARSDGNASFGENGGSAEACENHLAFTIEGMLDGDSHISAVVSVRWDS